MSNIHAVPGTLSGPYGTPSRAYLISKDGAVRVIKEILVGTTDATNTTNRTTYLRQGLVLGKVTASGKYTAYDDDGTDDGRRVALGVLDEDVDMLDNFGNALAAPILASILIRGHVDPAHLIGYDANGGADLVSLGMIVKGLSY